MHHSSATKPRLAVLLSGSGRTLENLLRVTADGSLDAEVVAVVSSRRGVRGITIAEQAGLPVIAISRKRFEDDAAFTTGAVHVIDGGWVM